MIVGVKMITFIDNQRIIKRAPLRDRLRSIFAKKYKASFKELSGLYKSKKNTHNKSNLVGKLFMPLLCFIVLIILTFFTLSFTPSPAIENMDISFENDYFQAFLREELFEYNEEHNNTSSQAFGIKSNKYKVKKGDTLGVIARKYGINIDTIISFNNIENARNIKVGTVLEIPDSAGLKYMVRRGDSLSIIAKRFKISVNSLLDWNNLDSTVIKVGQIIFIPGAKLSENERNKVLGKLFVKPTTGDLTSVFGMRNDPIAGVRCFHYGIDIANNPGTPILASMAGKVGRAGYEYRYGNFIILIHHDGFQTLYGHLNSILVSEGQYVAQGQKIGTMGNTGYSTGCHLHFGVFKNGDAVDPAKYVKY